jgi:hypothetical protein
MTRSSARLPDFVQPMQAKLVDSIKTGDWIYEIKFDGYRALALRSGSETRILSRNQKNLGNKFPEVVDSVASLKVQDAIIDGEIGALDEKGRSSFQLLQDLEMGRRPSIIYYRAHYQAARCAIFHAQASPLLPGNPADTKFVRKDRTANSRSCGANDVLTRTSHLPSLWVSLALSSSLQRAQLIAWIRQNSPRGSPLVPNSLTRRCEGTFSSTPRIAARCDGKPAD